MILGLGTLSLLSLGSCGGNNSSNDPNTIVFQHTFGQSATSNLEALAASFKKAVKANLGEDINIELDYGGSYSDILDKVKKSFSAGTTPTMCIAYPDHVAEYMDASNSYQYTVDLTPYIESKEYGFGTQSYLGDEGCDADDFVEAFYEEGSTYAKEGTYSLCFMKSSEALFYNEEMALRAYKAYKNDTSIGQDRLKSDLSTMSWSDFTTFATYIAENKASIYNESELKDFLAPIFYDSDSNMMISKFFQNKTGFSSIGEDGKGKIDFRTGENRTAAEGYLSEIKGLWEEGVLTTKGITGEYGSNYFKSGKVIFDISSTGGAGYNDPSGGSFNVKCVKVPASNNNPLYVSQGPTITLLRNSSKTDEVNNTRLKWAWMFAKYLTNKDNNVRSCIYGSEGYLPVRYSAYETEEFESYMEEDTGIIAQGYDVLINSVQGKYLNTAVFKGSATLRDQIGGAVSAVCKSSGAATVSSAIDTVISNTLNAM